MLIHQLRIERYRGIKSLTWNPRPGLNLVLGGGDVGKSTVLEAISTLFAPGYIPLSETDFWQREYNDGFQIRAVLSLPEEVEINHQKSFAWPWEWDGAKAIMPSTSDSETDQIPVYIFQVQGTPELEANWEIIQPNGESINLSANLRRQIGVVRLTSDEKSDRDLRLVYGSALDRLLTDNALKSRISQLLAQADLGNLLNEGARDALRALDDSLKQNALPHNLDLEVTSSQGISIGALIGLFAESENGVSLPLSTWGSGTRRMTTLEISAKTQSDARITLIDEIERGLEPHRLRQLTRSIIKNGGQSFATTHNPIAIRESSDGTLWYMDSNGKIGELDKSKVLNQQTRDPETFLSILTIACEGETEVGFVTYLLERAIDGSFEDYGIRVSDGGGNETVCRLLQSTSKVGLNFGGFVDNDDCLPTVWNENKQKLGDLLFQWPEECSETNIISKIPEERLDDIFKDEDGVVDGQRLRTIADRLASEDKDLDSMRQLANSMGKDLREVIIQAATGNTADVTDPATKKQWKKHGQSWFKSEAGGYELAQKMFSLGAWPELKKELLPFLNAVRKNIGANEINDLVHE